MLIVGLDPGGKGQFGWCVAETTNPGLVRLRKSGTGDRAADVLKRVMQYVGHPSELGAAGIDSPLFWVANGDRRADQVIRAAMTAFGATSASGTVQQLNSLWGACLVQGIMAARGLRQLAPGIRLTESHPKALLWLINVATRQRKAPDVGMNDLRHLIDCDVQSLSEHERDAGLGAVAALAMIERTAGWKDLAAEEEDAFVPVAPVEYWMPLA
jgi:hypothetical protein